MPPSKPVSKEDTELKDPDSKAAKKKAKEAGKAGGAENPAAWAMLGYGSSLFGAGFFALCMYAMAQQAYNIRMYAIHTYGYVIHEFDPWFNYRATEYLADRGWHACAAPRTTPLNLAPRSSRRHVVTRFAVARAASASAASSTGSTTCRGTRWVGPSARPSTPACRLRRSPSGSSSRTSARR